MVRRRARRDAHDRPERVAIWAQHLYRAGPYIARIVRGRAVAYLAVEVVAPGPYAAVALQGVARTVAGGDSDYITQPRHLQRGEVAAVVAGALTQFAVLVVAPGPH